MIPLAVPMVGAAEAEAAAGVVLSGWLTQGPEVAAFEAEFAALIGAPHACAVSNCTVALHLALLALGVGQGDEVVTVSHTFIASANAIRQCGATPVFVDILPGTFTMDPGAVAAAITPRTRAILCVHQMGMPCDLAALLPIARAHGLPLIEDAACAIGSEIHLDGRWQRIGAPHGDIACFSLHPRKVLTVGDGGVITTRNLEWDRLFRLWRQHGMSVPDAARHQSTRVVVEDYPTTGFNYRLTDVQAAIGRQQLKRLPWIIERRRDLADNYRALLAGIPGVRPPEEPPWARSNWQSYCVRLPRGSDQRAVMQAMLDRQIATRRGIMCIHMEPAYADLPQRAPLPASEQARDQSLLLPLFPQMTAEMQAEVVTSLREVLL
ncbi:DegT/DnrJ/EryC1/StrS family aminotransferase [Chelatococcus asaccharovorans]|uniref:DegT/DnrJ/EryC1/StrS family aminotransferase n=1 Tax=Chelatococcus asaccharovorans TaxID=28210 RepID=UPI00224C6EB3|nr:DegT/DnrJ/EryC1/StrS family aminotransferase [Chelatococcus asaccharovorans]CAH1668199.1 dTDP-4-amino-4,6-dideoxygalactose transaminase [Chelatococcus asaccharovorans]CAH1680300.1 dTDP-4-amino-4,6-dideoxygalactose transaminase [Chelatococcus asaccharovorans]